MEFSGVILGLLFLVVLGLFVYSLTEARGKNTVHARKEKSKLTKISEAQLLNNKDPISKSYNTSYNIKDRKTEAA